MNSLSVNSLEATLCCPYYHLLATNLPEFTLKNPVCPKSLSYPPRVRFQGLPVPTFRGFQYEFIWELWNGPTSLILFQTGTVEKTISTRAILSLYTTAAWRNVVTIFNISNTLQRRDNFIHIQMCHTTPTLIRFPLRLCFQRMCGVQMFEGGKFFLLYPYFPELKIYMPIT